MMRPIRKVLIANRGEIALRVIRTCRERHVGSVAVYSDVDRMMPHVVKADEALLIGAAPPHESYLNMDRLIQAAKSSGADAIHPGYGFLAENAEFAQRVQDAGLVFIGPSPASIRAMGDKTEAKRRVMAAGVPTVPGSPDAVGSVQEAESVCTAIGFPVLLKAAAGGGGRGMRVVRSAAELAAAFAAASGEAKTSFGDARLYVEKYIEDPRHVEIQIFGDQHGNVIHLGERECSVQRRHQKVIEESPSSALTPALREQMAATAVTAARACGYYNAGTVEFLVDGDGKFYFLEMNTRLQVEHPVTELRVGLDLVDMQLRVAAGEPLPVNQDQIRWQGHAIECRICAEDPFNNFVPATGTIVHLKTGGGPGVREDRGIEEGAEISVYYDSLIAKLSVWAPTRSEAIARMQRALDEYEILGVRTNVSFCAFVMRHQAFTTGAYNTGFVGRYYTPEKLREDQLGGQRASAVVAALLEGQKSGLQGSPIPVNGRNGTLEQTAPVSRWKSLRALSMRGGRLR